MPSQSFHVGPFTNIYIGISTASGVLTELTSVTTGETVMTYNIPQAYNFALNNMIQSGPHSISLTLRFLSDDPEVVKLAMGNFFSDNQDDPSAFLQYTLLLAHPDTEAESSILLPRCYTNKTVNLNWAKTNVTSIPLTFECLDRNRFNVLYYKDTLDNLSAILGSRSPLV